MEISEVLKNSIITGIMLHASYLALIIMLYINMRRSFNRNIRKNESSLDYVYIGCFLMLISDCAWSTVSSACIPGEAIAYIINLIYFISSSYAAICWFIFCTNHLDLPFMKKRSVRVCAIAVYDIMLLLYVLSPWYGFIFSIKDGEYLRGSVFYLDPLIKMGYIALASLSAVICGCRKKLTYLKKNDFNFAIFGVPVLICGILQVITGADFNCLGITSALVLIYINGITNPDSENTDAIYSLASSFDASYIINMDTGAIRPLYVGKLHSKNLSKISSMDYSIRTRELITERVCPEDQKAVLEHFELTNVAKRFQIDNSFSIRYRVIEKSGMTVLHTTSFIRATGENGKREFLIGINSTRPDSLLFERNEKLLQENQKLEQINTNILESVAKIVEARDSESGDHVVRVKKLTEIIAREIMAEYPEYNLDDEKIKLICSASVLHDVGKIVIPDAVLLKPGRLTDDEFAIMKTHTTRGCDILNMFPLGLDDAFLDCALSICRWHHEKYDGMGYPDGLKGDDIPIAAQIVSFADCFDALVNDRPYKKAYTPEKSFDMIMNGECGVFSPRIISAAENQKNRLMELAMLHT